MANCFADWFRQAEADLHHARNAEEDGDFEWSCFAAQQVAEKALKAVFQKHGLDAWGHTVTALIGNLAPQIAEPPEVLVNYTRILDKHFIPTRYPYCYDLGAPTDFYTQEEAQSAIHHAEAILEFCRDKIT